LEREKVSLSMKDPTQQSGRDGSWTRPNTNNTSRPNNQERRDDDLSRPDREETSGMRSNITFS
jgi:hypothetical protein